MDRPKYVSHDGKIWDNDTDLDIVTDAVVMIINGHRVGV